MAFGKRPIEQARVGSFRTQDNIRRQEKAVYEPKKRGANRFNNSFYAPVDYSTTIRLIPGAYKIPMVEERTDNGKKEYCVRNVVQEYFEMVRHYDGLTKKTLLCSAGPPGTPREKEKPCIPCLYARKHPKGRNEKGRFGWSKGYVWTVLEYGEFALVNQVDKEGYLKINERSGEPYTHWVKNLGDIEDILEVKEGHLQHWSQSREQFDEIMMAAASIECCCFSCQNKRAIRRSVIYCGNPTCQETIVDLSKVRLTDAEEEDLMSSLHHCPHCGQSTYPGEYITCNKCDNAVRASLFDADLVVRRIATTGDDAPKLRIEDFFLNPLDPSYKAKPMDLETMYQPDSIEIQERWTGLDLEDLMSDKPKPPPRTMHARNYK